MSNTSEKSRWFGDTTCDICGKDIHGLLYDAARSDRNEWATMCHECFESYGKGVEWGVGQQYEEDEDGDFFLVAGGPPNGDANEEEYSDDSEDDVGTSEQNAKVLAFAIEIGKIYFGGGIRRFSDFARLMTNYLGEYIKPFLKTAYYEVLRTNGSELRDIDYTPFEEVEAFDLDQIKKNNMVFWTLMTPRNMFIVAFLQEFRKRIVGEWFTRLSGSAKHGLASDLITSIDIFSFHKTQQAYQAIFERIGAPKNDAENCACYFADFAHKLCDKNI